MEKTQSTIQIRIDEKTKKLAQKTFSEVGLDMSSAVKLFLRNVVIHQSIPFMIRTKNGFTPAQEQLMLLETNEAIKKGKGYISAESLHKDIMRNT